MIFKRTILAVLIMPLAGAAMGGFEIEGTPALTTETGLLSNRTHYEQDAKASFRMPDAKLVPAQEKYADAKATMVVDKAYRVVTHKGTGKAIKALGYADSVPLNSALAMVIPSGWQVYQAKDLKNEALPAAVSYEGGQEWPDVLAALGEYNALRFHIDWYDKVVVMGQGRPVYTSNSSRVRIIEEPVEGIRKNIFGYAKPVAVKPVEVKPAEAHVQPNEAVAFKLPPHLIPRTNSGAIAANSGSLNESSGAVASAVKGQRLITSSVTGKTIVVSTGAVKPSDVKPSDVKPSDVKPFAVSSRAVINPDEKPVVVSAVPDKKLTVDSKVIDSVPNPMAAGYSVYVRKGFLSENIIRLSQENNWNPPDWQIAGDFEVASSFSVSGKSFPEAIAKLLMIHPVEADVNTNQRKIYVTKEVQ